MAIKKLFSSNLSACLILVLDNTFVPNLTFLDHLSPDISFAEKTVTQSPTHPAYFAIRETQCGVNLSELINMECHQRCK